MGSSQMFDASEKMMRPPVHSSQHYHERECFSSIPLSLVETDLFDDMLSATVGKLPGTPLLAPGSSERMSRYYRRGSWP